MSFRALVEESLLLHLKSDFSTTPPIGGFGRNDNKKLPARLIISKLSFGIVRHSELGSESSAITDKYEILKQVQDDDIYMTTGNVWIGGEKK